MEWIARSSAVESRWGDWWYIDESSPEKDAKRN
jgi:hypothetical protein